MAKPSRACALALSIFSAASNSRLPSSGLADGSFEEEAAVTNLKVRVLGTGLDGGVERVEASVWYWRSPQ